MKRAWIKIAGILWQCAAVCVFPADDLFAEEPAGKTTLSSEDITETVAAVTRSIRVRIKFDAQDYALPETAPIVSIENVLFEKNSAVLPPAARAQLDEMAKALRLMRSRGIFVRIKPEENAAEETPFVENRPAIPLKVLIEGHTCDLGSSVYNQDLSERRASAVREYLLSRGGEAAMFEVKGWGEERPIAPNTCETLRRENRRVDFVLRPHRCEVPEKLRETKTRSLTDGRTTTSRFLDIAFTATALSEGGKQYQNNAIDLLRAGDRVRAAFTVSEACHVCALLLHPDERVDWLLPKNGPDYKQYSLWCQFAKDYEVPEFALGPRPGTSILYVIASHVPLPEPTDLPSILRRRGISLNAKTLSEDTRTRELEVYALTVHQE